MDVLALALFDLMAPIALKLASADGDIDPAERTAISSYFVKEWGFDADFTREGISFTESRLPDFSVRDLAQALAELKKSNKDCNYNDMAGDFVDFLREISEADGRIHPGEKIAIEQVRAVFDEAGHSSLKRATKKVTTGISGAAEGSKRAVSKMAGKLTKLSPRSKPGKS